jgi:hypothetical protein
VKGSLRLVSSFEGTAAADAAADSSEGWTTTSTASEAERPACVEPAKTAASSNSAEPGANVNKTLPLRHWRCGIMATTFVDSF